MAVQSRSESERFQVTFSESRGVLTLDYKLPNRASTMLARHLPAGWTHVQGHFSGPRDHRISHTIRGGARAIIRTVGGIDVELGGRRASKFASHTTMPTIHPGDDTAGETDECACAFPARCSKCQIKPGSKCAAVDVAYYLDFPKLFVELAGAGASMTSFQWRCTRGFRGVPGEWAVSEEADGLSILVEGNAHSYKHGFSDPFAEAYNISSPFGVLRVENAILWGFRTKLYDLAVTSVTVGVPRPIIQEREVVDDDIKVATYDPASAVAALLRASQTSGGRLEDAVRGAYNSALRVARAHASARAALSRRDLALMDNYEAYRVGVTRRLRLSIFQEITCFLGDVKDVVPDVVGDICSLTDMKLAARRLVEYWWLAVAGCAVVHKYGVWWWCLAVVAIGEAARAFMAFYVHVSRRYAA